MINVKLIEQTISQLRSLQVIQFSGNIYLAKQEASQYHYGWMAKESVENPVNRIDILAKSCYNEFTFPPIFRDGVRGGYAASAVLIGG